MTFENDQNRLAFFDTLIEFGSVIGFLLLLMLSVYYWTGLGSGPSRTIRCDAERVVNHEGLLAYVSDGSYFTGGKEQNGDFAHSGQYSLQLTKASPFGFEYIYPYTHPYEEFTISVWRYSNGKDSSKGILVAVASGMWKGADEVVEKADNGWEKISITFSPPVASHNHPLKIYCWNNGYEPIYFDDLQIEIRQKEDL